MSSFASPRVQIVWYMSFSSFAFSYFLVYAVISDLSVIYFFIYALETTGNYVMIPRDHKDPGFQGRLRSNFEYYIYFFSMYIFSIFS